MVFVSKDFHPKNGRTLKVIRIARISTINQDERSLEDQLELLKEYVEKIYEKAIEYHDLATQGSGEKLDREELLQLEEMIESGQYDLVISEDLARICRRLHAITICEMCEDRDTRLIAINDRVDTSDEGWRDGAFISSWHHERSNKDTSDRIKRSLRNRFRNGAILSDPGPFYIVPEEAQRIDEVQKKRAAEEIVLRGFEMLEQGDSYSDVADWLNVLGFPVGGQSRKQKWDVHLVKSRFLDPRLKGIEEWNNKSSVRDNKSGRRRSKNAPKELKLTRDVPHLAIVDPERFDKLKRKLTERNSHYCRSDEREEDPLLRRPKKRTPFPGQSIYCGICGHKYVFGGHGQKDHLMCDGARQYECWCGASVDGPLAAQKIADAILSEYENLAEFDEKFRKMVVDEARQADEGRHTLLNQLRQRLRQVDQKIENYLAFIAGGNSNLVREKLAEAEEDQSRIREEIGSLQTTPRISIEIPTAEELKALAHEQLKGLDPFSWEFNKIMQRLIPKIVVFPYRLIDGGHVVLRAKFRLQMGELVSESRVREMTRQTLERIVCVDLFDPPQREAYRAQVRSMRMTGLNSSEIAIRLRITKTAVLRAEKLQREMDQKKLDESFQPVLEPPSDYTKMRRHQHKRYDFKPKPNAGEI